MEERTQTEKNLKLTMEKNELNSVMTISKNNLVNQHFIHKMTKLQ